MSSRPALYIGNKRYSSWSLRPWLALRAAGVDFEEVIIPLDTPEFATRVATLSPSLTVPVLRTEGAVIWDSLAIVEWAAEQVPALWPRDPAERAVGRSLASTMHAGFRALRAEAPMNLGRDGRGKTLSPAVRRDMDLVQALWREHRDLGGPYFFRDWSIVDAFWTPVATRIRSYAIEVEPAAQAYVETLLDNPYYLEWRAAALAETYPHPLNEEV
jgi:glutathione S-transferase